MRLAVVQREMDGDAVVEREREARPEPEAVAQEDVDLEGSRETEPVIVVERVFELVGTSRAARDASDLPERVTDVDLEGETVTVGERDVDGLRVGECEELVLDV